MLSVGLEPTIPVFEDSSCLRPRGQCDRRRDNITFICVNFVYGMPHKRVITAGSSCPYVQKRSRPAGLHVCPSFVHTSAEGGKETERIKENER
jgi:hypothetical protein